MKNIKLLFIFTILSAFMACEPEYEPLNDYSAIDWFTTAFGNEAKVSIDKYMSYSDLSQNELSHTWSFSDTSGCVFLKGPISAQDKIFDEFIDEDAGNESTDKTVHVLFTKGGRQALRLYNTFSEEVTFYGNDTLYSNYTDGEWVIDTTFIIDVYDSIQPAFKVYKEDVEIISVPYDSIPLQSEKDLWTVVEVTFGNSLMFVDLTEKGRPDTYSWEFTGATPEISEDSVSMIAFNSIGTFTGKYKASRSDEDLTASKTKIIPLKIKVIASNEELVFKEANKSSSNIIGLQISGGIAPFTGQEATFTVHATNENGFDEDITVSEAKVNELDATIIDLVLADEVYNNDVITVTYTGNKIESLDERILSKFSDELVKVFVGNILDEEMASFEDADVLINSDYWKSEVKGTGTAEYSTEQAASGNQSIKGENPGTSGNQMRFTSSLGGLLNIEAGVTYTVRYKRFVTDGSDSAGGDKFYIGGLNETQINKAENLLDPGKNCHEFVGTPLGVWYEMEFDWTADKDYVDAFFTLQVNPKVGTFYYDDFFIAAKLDRPE
ncbi:hypothetical protein [Saccharicrinis aurantiacus]|uniref:hypothetical protein n=1 Tax=Saccharicrinis aurantiacus TaxID=1849719 RepID=UPI0008396D41|nr:hypothetical protein [Saccharicrinis aurantiacus]